MTCPHCEKDLSGKNGEQATIFSINWFYCEFCGGNVTETVEQPEDEDR